MSETQPTLEELELESTALQERLLKILEQKQRIIKETELSRPQVVQVTSFSNEQIVFKTNGIPREDVLNLLRNTNSRFYDRVTQVNKVHVRDWKEFLFSFKALPNTEIVLTDEVQLAIENFVNEPLITVIYGAKDIEIRLATRSRDWYIFDKIPGKTVIHSVKENKSIIHVPYSEAWRLGQVIQNYDDKVIDEKTAELISKQTESRIQLDTIAQLEDTELDVDMNGHTLRPFQRVGVKFALLALGETLE